MHQFSRDELREMFNESIREAKELAKQKGASVYYGIGDLWIREQPDGQRFVVIDRENGDREEVPYEQ
jgi:hypothetical protein